MTLLILKRGALSTYLTGLLQVEVVGGDAREDHDQGCEEGEGLHSDVLPNHLGLRQHPLRGGHYYLSFSAPALVPHK